ncbi:MAG: peptidyl-dipeptidase Dcp [Chitinophagaceae bacterium]|nr:peptidyl-dipeptidase Dcp [Chitinophagaceae bacterium]
MKLFLIGFLLFITMCGKTQNTFTSSNPFYSESKLSYQAPAFDKIKNGDFKPALVEGMRVQLQEIEKIANNSKPPTVDNTLVAMEKSGVLLERVRNIFNLYKDGNTNDELQKVSEEIAPKLAAHRDAIYLNTKLFKRIGTIYNNRRKLKLDAESNRLIEFYYQRFQLSGAKLSDLDKAKLKELNGQEATLIAKFNNQLLLAGKNGALVINNKSELAGLTQGEIDAASRDAKTRNLTDKWILPLQNTTQQPSLQSLANRDTRQKLFEASWNRAEKNDSNDTRNTISQMSKIRAEQAKLMGFPSYAAWKLQDQMAKTPEAVQQFFDRLVPAATAKAKTEAADIQALIDKQNGGFKLQPWDWNYYSEQVRKEKYDLDDSQIKPYFELNNVLENGVFYAANQLYGLTFTERHDLPVWQPDVRVFEVHDKDNSIIGLFYCDYYKRDNKSGGAWMDNLVNQSKLLGTKPVIFNVCNFTKPATGQPSLISFTDATTMFHEFGHALHGFFANQKFLILSGTSVARDFVEFPSQFNEHWALDPNVLKHYAIHYKTKEPIPEVLVDKIKKAGTFNQGYKLTEALAASALDLQWHTLSENEPIKDVDRFEKESLKKTKLDLPEVPPRYRSSYFLHIWYNGYAAGYYAYQWTEMLDDDAYSWFEENGGLTRANGQRFRDMILSKGNTEDYGKMFRAFRGHDPNIKPMQISRGLISK